MTGINDDVIQRFVASLPGLRCFRLQIKTNVTHRALRILEEGCARMRHCALEGRIFYFRLLEGNGPVLFPQLESLELKPPVVGHSAAEHAKILHYHAPCAKKFRMPGSLVFDSGTDDKIRGLQHQYEGQSLVQSL